MEIVAPITSAQSAWEGYLIGWEHRNHHPLLSEKLELLLSEKLEQ
jgi:hypothetical protein